MIFAKIKVSFCHTFKDRRFQKILKQPPVKQNGRPRDLLRATVIHSAAGIIVGMLQAMDCHQAQVQKQIAMQEQEVFRVAASE